METIVVKLRDDLFVVPSMMKEQLDWKDGARLLIEKQNGRVALLLQRLTAEEIADIACTYLAEYVGDATAVKTPVWKDGKWRVEAVLSYRPETIGFLTFSQAGDLIEEESDSVKKLKGMPE